jgi:hypothetical protein
MLDSAHGLGMSQRVISRRAGRKLDPIVLTHSLDGFDKRFLRAKVR